MKKCTCGASALSTGIVLAVSALGSAQAVDLPAGAAYPTNTASNPGFLVRTAQAPTNYVAGNSYVRALKQLDGTLRDDANNLVANVAIAGTNASGAYYTDVVSFEKDASGVFIQDADGNPLGYLVADYFPGIPGTEGETTQFAVEAVGLVPLEAGTHTLGISASADRTDVNDDDGYVVYVGANPRDYFSTKIAEFSRGNAKPFTANQQVENIITVTAPVTGLYPFRIVYWQTGRGATLSLYEINTNTTQRTLINDPNDTSSLRAYRSTTGVRYNAPYVAEISPVPDSAGNSAAAPIEVVLFDGPGATLGSVQFWLNGVAKTPQLSKVGSRLTVTYSPDPTRTDPNNTVKLVYADSNGAFYTNQWAFTIITEGGSANPVKGQWDFNFGDLRATVGNALSYLDPTYDGASGSSSDKTTFGTCTTLGVPLINGQEAVVMRVPGELTRKIGYVMEHGIAPNGGGSRVNQFTIIMDVYVETSGAGAASLLQMDQDNTSDGDLFWQGNNFGQGTGGYNGKGTFTAGAWHRVSAAYDMAASTPVVTKFVDGIKQDDWTSGHSLDGVRRSLAPTAVLFGDGDQDERRAMYVNSIQIRAGKVSDAELYALGGPSAAGVPAEIPKSTVTGQWDFNYGDLSASIGKALNYLDPTYDGASGSSSDKTTFGTCTTLGVPLIDGQEAAVMRVPGELTRKIGYVMEHGIAPNGGGSRVNQFTLIMDVYVETSGAGAASLLQMDQDNTSDGDLFWQGNNFGQGTGGYNGKGTFTAGAWHRVSAAYDMAASTPVVTKFVDGIKQDDWTSGHSLDGVRRSLAPTAVLFGDGDQDERRAMYVNSIQIRAGKLSDAELCALGGPSAAGVPAEIPSSTVAGQWDFNSGDLSASIGKALNYLDPTFDGASGTSENKTAFGLASVLGVAGIGTNDPAIVQVPGDLTRKIGYLMDHGIAPNGGGSRVNQFTLIMDVMVDTSGAGAASLLQMDSDNTSDGDLFWQGNNFGQGSGGYNGLGTFTAGQWHRVAAAYDMAASTPVVTKYVDGIFQDDWVTGHSLDGARRSLGTVAVLFGDGDQDERRTMWVDSIQIRAGALSKPELESLGAPTGLGIPVALGVAAAPTLDYGKLGNQLVFWWPLDATGYVLESSPSLSNPTWTAVATTTVNSGVVTVGTGNLYFRLRK